MKNIIKPISSKILENEKVIHGFFTKNGSLDKKQKINFNCSLNIGKNLNKNRKNRENVANFHNLKLENLKTTKQTHSNKILVINNYKEEVNNINADAMITAIPNIVLGIVTADCAPVLAYDFKNNIIAAIHMGWKSSYKDILELTINKMINLGCNVNNISLSIGPCIGPQSYEVGDEFYEKFITKNIKYASCFSYKKNKYFFNLPQFIIFKANKIGIKKEFMWTSNKDTFLEKELFYSYRRNTKNNIPDDGRMLSTISIKKYNE